MCTYSQLKKKLCVTPHRVNGTPNVPKLYASGGKKLSKSIKGGSMKLTKLVDHICVASLQKGPHVAIYQSLENKS